MESEAPAAAMHHEDPLSCTTVFVGFPEFAARGAGVLTRTGVHAVRLDMVTAVRLFRSSLAFDAMVVDLTDPATLGLAALVFELLDDDGPDAPRPVVVAVAGQALPRTIRAALSARAVPILARQHLSWRALALVLRRSLSLNTDNHPTVARPRPRSAAGRRRRAV